MPLSYSSNWHEQIIKPSEELKIYMDNARQKEASMSEKQESKELEVFLELEPIEMH